MKNYFLLLIVSSFFVEAQVVSPQASPFSTVTQVVGLTEIKIEYSRPSMKGRKIIGNIVPYGELWRTGANANTKVTFSDPVTISGKIIPQGTYALYTRPGKTMWEIFFYSKSDNWSLPKEWDSSQVAVVSESPVFNSVDRFESFSIQIQNITSNDADLIIAWENTIVRTNIKVPTAKKTLESIKKTLANNPKAEDYYKAAVYYLNSDIDLDKAKKWMEIAVEKGNNKYYHLRQYSLILAALGDKKSAVKVARNSYELADKAGNKDYLKMNKESIEKWSK
ncbi:MAG: dihydrolipoamide dehydrogenase [Flavobacteriaceae bacterium]|nr:dihydrolipoamide dehydrogenase [Flavobacteriaceae bacterium]